MSRYSFGEILSGILISVVGIIFVSAFFDVVVHGKTYDNYCCCNLETIYLNASNNYERKPFNDAFCILYDSTEQKKYFYTDIKNPTSATQVENSVTNVINIFKDQMKINEEQFSWYLYLRNIPIYIIPNIPCHTILDKSELEQKDIQYGCIDLNIERNLRWKIQNY